MTTLKEDREVTKGAWLNSLGLVLKSSKAIYLVILPRLFGPYLFGIHLLVISLHEALAKLSSLGFEWATVRVASQYKSRNQTEKIEIVVWYFVKKMIPITFFISMFFAALSSWFSDFVFHKPELTGPLLLSSVGLPILNLQFVLVFALRSTRNMKYEVWVKSLVEPGLLLIFGLLAAFFYRNIYGMMLAYLISITGATLLAFYFFKKEFPKKVKSHIPDFRLKELLAYSIPMAGMDFFNTIKAKIDLLVIGRLLSFEFVGIYGAIVELGNLIKKIRMVYEPILMPILVHFDEKKDTPQLNRQFWRANRVIFLVSLGMLIPMSIFPEYILSYFGKTFIQGKNALLILSWGTLIYSTLGLSEIVLAMIGYSKTNFFISLGLIVINLGLDFLWIPDHGLIGAAWASTVSLGVASFVRWLCMTYFLATRKVPNRR